MKRASYREAVDFIALNDEPGESDPDQISGYTTVQLIAGIFAVEAERVAKDIIRIRNREGLIE